jgi:hypothetical protein
LKGVQDNFIVVGSRSGKNNFLVFPNQVAFARNDSKRMLVQWNLIFGDLW